MLLQNVTAILLQNALGFLLQIGTVQTWLKKAPF